MAKRNICDNLETRKNIKIGGRKIFVKGKRDYDKNTSIKTEIGPMEAEGEKYTEVSMFCDKRLFVNGFSNWQDHVQVLFARKDRRTQVRVYISCSEETVAAEKEIKGAISREKAGHWDSGRKIIILKLFVVDSETVVVRSINTKEVPIVAKNFSGQRILDKTKKIPEVVISIRKIGYSLQEKKKEERKVHIEVEIIGPGESGQCSIDPEGLAR